MKLSFLDKSLKWILINPESYILPNNSNFGIDEGGDVAEFSFFSDKSYFIDMIFKCEYEDSIPIYWIAKNVKESNLKIGNKKIITLTLMEPIEVLQGFKLEPCKFAEGHYTLEQIISRLFKLSKFDGEYILPNIKYNNSEFQFVQSTLYLALFEVSRTIDCIPYFDFNEITKKWILKFESLDLINKIVYEI